MRTSTLFALAPLLLCFHCGEDEPAGKPSVETERPDATDVEPEPEKDAGPKPVTDAGKPDAGPDPNAFPQALDAIELGSVDGDAEISFELPANVAGFQIIAKRDAAETPFSVRSLISPNGNSIISANRFVGTDKIAYQALSTTTLAATVPQHDTADGVTPPAGTWKLRLDNADGDVDVRILLRRTEDGKPKPGVLDLKVYIPEGLVLDNEEIDVAGAETSDPVQDRLAAFDDGLEKLYGVKLGRVRFASMPSRFRHLEENFFEAGLETEGEGRLLHVVFSEETSSFWGIAGGIPGAVGTGGVENSVFALSSLWSQYNEADFPALRFTEGSVLAHEAGHFLGLFHTSELDGEDADPLDDTPLCPSETIGNFDLESCPDYENVMFPSSDVPEHSASVMQKRIVQGSALLRGFSLEGATSMRRPRSIAHVQPGFLFHAPGKPLTVAQKIALAAGSCGSGAHPHARPSAATRAELERIAADVSLPAAFRGGARRALGH